MQLFILENTIINIVLWLYKYSKNQALICYENSLKSSCYQQLINIATTWKISAYKVIFIKTYNLRLQVHSSAGLDRNSRDNISEKVSCRNEQIH